MAGTKLISTRLTVCATCGSPGRLIVATSEEVVSRCYACGDAITTQSLETVQLVPDVAELTGSAVAEVLEAS
jgi:hypothetical protein